jgi:hypothetical protein
MNLRRSFATARRKEALVRQKNRQTLCAYKPAGTNHGGKPDRYFAPYVLSTKPKGNYMKFDCGMSDDEHCEWELRFRFYELILDLHASVGEFDKFLDEFVAAKKKEPGFEMQNICFDTIELFEPILKRLQTANEEIRSQYGLTEQNQSLPSNQKDSSK